ncbi:MAG TPA: S1/P1 nuclease [Vicinamibacterales bacterium]|nr:S1/P1 nuclease [Vicinamibacterales bacterium]
MRAAALFCIVAWFAGAEPAAAWSNEGHLVICEIAFQRLSPKARAFVDAVRAHASEIRDPFRDCPGCAAAHPDDGRPMTFREGCVWPDEAHNDTFRGTYEYHFLNVPANARSIDVARDCGRLDCVLAGIQRYAQYLVAPPRNSRERERQALALRFLGHFVGDLHQPLHVAHGEDLGGNLIEVRFVEDGKTVARPLHAVWDVVVLRRGGLTTPQAAAALNAEISGAEAGEWSEPSLLDWASESLIHAQFNAYRHPDGSAVQNGGFLDEEYLTSAIGVARLRLKQAGVRLAALIEAAAEGELPQLLTLAP